MTSAKFMTLTLSLTLIYDPNPNPNPIPCEILDVEILDACADSPIVINFAQHRAATGRSRGRLCTNAGLAVLLWSRFCTSADRDSIASRSLLAGTSGDEIPFTNFFAISGGEVFFPVLPLAALPFALAFPRPAVLAAVFSVPAGSLPGDCPDREWLAPLAAAPRAGGADECSDVAIISEFLSMVDKKPHPKCREVKQTKN